MVGVTHKVQEMIESFANEKMSWSSFGCGDAQIAERLPLMAGSVPRCRCCDWVGVTRGFKCLEWSGVEEGGEGQGRWILRVKTARVSCFLAGSGWLWEGTSGD